MSAQEAKEFGIVDEVVKSQPPLGDGKTDSTVETKDSAS
jgi:enoyl-CoA hydratase/carnithine racemase